MAARSFGASTVWPLGSLTLVPLPYWSVGGVSCTGPVDGTLPPWLDAGPDADERLPSEPPPSPPLEDGCGPPMCDTISESLVLAALTTSAASLAYFDAMPAMIALACASAPLSLAGTSAATALASPWNSVRRLWTSFSACWIRVVASLIDCAVRSAHPEASSSATVFSLARSPNVWPFSP